MNVTSRDKKLLLVLALVLGIFLYYQFLLTPQEARLAELESQRDAAMLRQSEIVSTIAMKPSIEEEIIGYETEMSEMQDLYYGNLEQEELLAIVDAFNPQEVIGFKNYQFTDATDRSGEVFHESYGLVMDFVGPYDAIKSFLGRFEAEEKLIDMNSFRLTRDQNGGLTGSINMAFHGLPTLNGYNGTYKTFDTYRTGEVSEEETPFDTFEGYQAATAQPEEIIIGEDESVTIEIDPTIRTTIAGFEGQPYFTVPKPETVVARTSYTTQSYTGGRGLDIAYNFLERMPEASVNIVFDGRPVMINSRAERLSLFVNRREASSHPISAVLIDATGDQVELYFTGDQTVGSWEEQTTGLPGDLSYPVKVQRLVIHSGGIEGALTGHLVIDSLQTVITAAE